MKVVIKEREYDYTSDYPEGWLFSSGDYFKFPVAIGNYPCFIKRFEKKSPASITGWDLMVKLEQKYEPNLARIYDIASVEEKGRRIYYVFYEYLKGTTLDNLISRNMPFDLTRLTNDLFRAMASLQAYEYWFSDFIEKNIFLDEAGRFVLMDLDSAQPASKIPNNDMYGNKDYWVLVFSFYKNILQYSDIKVGDLSGLMLNYLQLVFFVLRLKLAFRDKQYQYAETFNELPAELDKIDPAFKEVFRKIYEERQHPPFTERAAELKELIIQKIIPYKSTEPPVVIPNPGVPKPVIREFASDVTTVEKGQPFELHWQVEEAAYVELYKNEAFDSKFDNGETRVTKKAFYDGGNSTVSYKLMAYNKEEESTTSDPVIINIQIKEPPVEPKPLKPQIREFTASSSRLKNGDRFSLNWQVENATYVELYRNDALDSKHKATENSVTKTASFNAGEQKFSYTLIAYQNSERVKSNPLEFALTKAVKIPVKLIAIVLGSLLAIFLLIKVLSSSPSPKKSVIVSSISPVRVNGLEPITIHGRNFLKNFAAIQVRLNNIKGNIQSHSDTTLEVRFPDKEEPSRWKGAVKVAVLVNNEILYAPNQMFIMVNGGAVVPVLDSSSGQVVTTDTSTQTVDNAADKERKKRDSLLRRWQEELNVQKAKQKLEEKKRKDQKRVRDSVNRAMDSINRKREEVKTKEDSKEQIKKTIYNSVSVTPKYKNRSFGGVKDIQITVTNNSDYFLDNVAVEVSYQSDKKGERKKVALNFENINPHSTATKDAPKGPGSTVTPVIKSIDSKGVKMSVKTGY